MEQISLSSPIGRMVLSADNKGLTSIEIGGGSPASRSSNNSHLKRAAQELNEYFKGRRTKFSVSLSVSGTKFQRDVWDALSKIPYGKTASYADVAKAIENSKAVRAVGLANKKNPIPIIVPCHRVINKSGKLGGYNLGLNRKKWLLKYEKYLSAQHPQAFGASRANII